MSSRFTAHVTTETGPKTLTIYADSVVPEPDGDCLWFYTAGDLVGSLPTARLRMLFRDDAQ